MTVEAHHAGARPDVEAAVRDLRTLLGTYAGGHCVSHILDTAQPDFVDAAASGSRAERGR